jgi:hypothetical protein
MSELVRTVSFNDDILVFEYNKNKPLYTKQTKIKMFFIKIKLKLLVFFKYFFNR